MFEGLKKAFQQPVKFLRFFLMMLIEDFLSGEELSLENRGTFMTKILDELGEGYKLYLIDGGMSIVYAGPENRSHNPLIVAFGSKILLEEGRVTITFLNGNVSVITPC